MYSVENKFEIGEECYSVYRKPTHYKCPICEGNGKFPYKGYEIWCKNCSGSGKLHNPKQSVMAVCKVKVRRLIASIWQDQITIKYKVDGVDEFKLVNVRNRGENNLFKTKEEAEKYCVDVNYSINNFKINKKYAESDIFLLTLCFRSDILCIENEI